MSGFTLGLTGGVAIAAVAILAAVMAPTDNARSPLTDDSVTYLTVLGGIGDQSGAFDQQSLTPTFGLVDRVVDQQTTASYLQHFSWSQITPVLTAAGSLLTSVSPSPVASNLVVSKVNQAWGIVDLDHSVSAFVPIATDPVNVSSTQLMAILTLCVVLVASAFYLRTSQSGPNEDYDDGNTNNPGESRLRSWMRSVMSSLFSRGQLARNFDLQVQATLAS